MRCTKRIPLILSVLALPLILSGIAQAGEPNAQKNKEVDAMNLEPELWQLHAHGHHHLYNSHHHKKANSKKKQSLQSHAKKAGKKTQKQRNHKRASDEDKHKGRNLAAIVVEEDKNIAGFEPELWQLHAYGHNHQQKVWSKLEKESGGKAIKKKTNAKKLKSKKKKIMKRAIPLFLQDQLKVKQKKGGVDAQHKGHGKHRNPEDEEHEKYKDDEDIDGGDDDKDDKDKDDDKKKGNGDKSDKKNGKKKGGSTNDNEDDTESNLPDKGAKKGGNKKGDKKGGNGTKDDTKTTNPKDGKAPVDPAKPVADPAKPNAKPGAKPVADPSKPATAPAKPPKGAPAPVVPIQAKGEFITKCNTPGQIALTYAEGPSEATTQMLDILSEAKARVTFFTNATWLQYMQYAGVARKAYNEGHLIAMTYRLPNDSSKGMTDAQIKADIVKSASSIQELIGVYPKYVRLHEASSKDARLESLLRQMGYLLVGFNLDEADYKYTNHEQAAQIATIYETTFAKQAEAFGRKGSYVVVGYDIPATGAAAALPDVIQSILRNEYDMVRLDGCLNDSTPYKKSAAKNDGYVGDDFSFGHPKYVHGQSPVAVRNGHPVPGKMPDKNTAAHKGSSSASVRVNSAILGLSLVIAPAILMLTGF
ncbi:chitin deacetylase [Actinomortierella ambigua]|nr:chitin deacetylase [Actinomortierella ambigua]